MVTLYVTEPLGLVKPAVPPVVLLLRVMSALSPRLSSPSSLLSLSYARNRNLHTTDGKPSRVIGLPRSQQPPSFPTLAAFESRLSYCLPGSESKVWHAPDHEGVLVPWTTSVM